MDCSGPHAAPKRRNGGLWLRQLVCQHAGRFLDFRCCNWAATVRDSQSISIVQRMCNTCCGRFTLERNLIFDKLNVNRLFRTCAEGLRAGKCTVNRLASENIVVERIQDRLGKTLLWFCRASILPDGQCSGLCPTTFTVRFWKAFLSRQAGGGTPKYSKLVEPTMGSNQWDWISHEMRVAASLWCGRVSLAPCGFAGPARFPHLPLATSALHPAKKPDFFQWESQHETD